MSEWLDVLVQLNARLTPMVKPLATTAYVAFGLFLLWAAIRRGNADDALPTRGWFWGTRAVVVVAGLLTLRYGLDHNFALLLLVVLAGAACLGAAVVTRHPIWSGAILPTATVALVVSAAWWMLREDRLDVVRLACACVVLGMLGVWQLLPARRTDVGRWPWWLSTPLVALVCLDVSSIAAGSEALLDMSSHWSAFIAPAQQVRAGLVPLFDLPVKYGPGPLTLTVAGCASSLGCWSALRLTILILSLATWWLVLEMALTVSRPRSVWWRAAITVVLGAAMFMWPGVPYLGIAPFIEPGTTGLRVFPLVLVAHQLWGGHHRRAGAAFAVAVVWSVEVAVWATVVYGVVETSRLGFAVAARRVAARAGAAIGVSLLLYRLWFAQWPDPMAIVEDLVVMPGAQDLLPLSSVLLLVVSLGLGGWMVWHPREEPMERRRDLVAVLLWFTSASYYLGSGHNNNLCAMLAFLVLLGCRAADRARDTHDRPLGWTIAAGHAALVAVLAFSPWDLVPMRSGFQGSLSPVINAMPTLFPDIEAIRSRLPSHETIGVATFATVRRDVRETTVWTPVEPYDTWGAMSSARRRVYIARGAMRLARPGWAIFSATQDELFDDIHASYRAQESWMFSGSLPLHDGTVPVYRVVKWVPR